MNRKLKCLGLSVLTFYVMGSLLSSAAVAGDFHSELSTDTVFKAEQVGTDVLTFNSGTTKCNEKKYTGTQTGATATSVKLVPEITECTAFGYVNSAFDSKQCTLEFSGDNGSMSIACPPTEPLTITSFNCWVTIPSQTLSGVIYTNVGAGASRHINLKVAIAGIHYVQHSKTFPGCTNGTQTNGQLTGEITLRGYSTGGTQVGIWRQ